MKAYGFKRKDCSTCTFGCCKLKKHPNVNKGAAKSARKAARRHNKALCIAVTN